VKQGRGFTLIEIAVVLLLIGLIMAAGVRYLNSQLTSAAYAVTDKHLQTVKDALITYLRKNRRLPCPSDPNAGDAGSDPTLSGNESRDPGSGPPRTCSGGRYFGVVPYTELGLTKDVALDGWGNFISYGVSVQWTQAISSAVSDKTTNVPTQGFSAGIFGDITVNTPTGTIAKPDVDPTKNTAAAVVLVSYGKNGLGAYTVKATANADPDNVNEIENLERDADPNLKTFFKDEYSDTYDDVVMLLMPDDFTSQLVKEGSIASAVQLNEKFQALGNSIVGAIVPSADRSYATLPASNADFQAGLISDPYGCGDIQYTIPAGTLPQNGNVIYADPTMHSPVPGTTGGAVTTGDAAYLLTSLCAPTGVTNTYSVTVGELRGILLKSGALKNP